MMSVAETMTGIIFYIFARHKLYVLWFYLTFLSESASLFGSVLGNLTDEKESDWVTLGDIPAHGFNLIALFKSRDIYMSTWNKIELKYKDQIVK